MKSEKWYDKYLNDPRSTDELLALVLIKDMDRDDEEYWVPVRCLQYRLPAIFEQIDALLKSEVPKTRGSAAIILGQKSVQEKWNVRCCVDKLLQAIDGETSTEALASSLHALGSLHDRQSISGVLRFAQHPMAEVRFATVHALSGHDETRAIAALVQLSADADVDVRNWATFGLGSQIDTDSPTIREALLTRATDADDEIRGEAMVGLARRGDARVVPMIIHELNSQTKEVLCGWYLIQETAEEIADNSITNHNLAWLPVLQRFHDLHIGDLEKIQTAIRKLTT